MERFYQLLAKICLRVLQHKGEIKLKKKKKKRKKEQRPSNIRLGIV